MLELSLLENITLGAHIVGLLIVLFYCTFLCNYNRLTAIADQPNNLADLRARQHDSMRRFRIAQDRHRAQIIPNFAEYDKEKRDREIATLDNSLRSERVKLSEDFKKEIDDLQNDKTSVSPLWRMVMPYFLAALVWEISIPLAFAAHLGKKAQRATMIEDENTEFAEKWSAFKAWEAEQNYLENPPNPLLDIDAPMLHKESVA